MGACRSFGGNSVVVPGNAAFPVSLIFLTSISALTLLYIVLYTSSKNICYLFYLRMCIFYFIGSVGIFIGVREGSQSCAVGAHKCA